MAHPRPTTVGALATVTVGIAFAAVLLGGSLRPSTLVWTGPIGPSYPIVVRDFGSAHLGSTTGRDAQQYYAIASEFPHIHQVVPYLDSPRYRLLRILEPVLASLAPRGAPIILTTLALNIVGVGLAAFSLATLGPRIGLRTWTGYAAGATLLPAVVQSTPDSLATGFALLGLMWSVRGRHWHAVATLVLAAMTRETTIVVAAVCGIVTVVGGRSLWPGISYATPAAAIGGWYLYLGTVTTAPLPHEFELLGITKLSFGEFALAAALFVISVAGAWRWRREPAVGGAAAIFGAWMLVQRPDSLLFDSAPRVFSFAITVAGVAVAGWSGAVLSRFRHPTRARPA